MFGRSGKIALLEKVPLLAGLSRRQLQEIARLADEVDVPAGKRLASVGDVGSELFVIIEGRASARVNRGREVILGPGEFFGEMSLIDGGPRSATVDAATNMRLLVVARREFWELLRVAPPLALTIMKTLSRRVRTAEASHST